jgi:hypothetical protein
MACGFFFVPTLFGENLTSNLRTELMANAGVAMTAAATPATSAMSAILRIGRFLLQGVCGQ